MFARGQPGKDAPRVAPRSRGHERVDIRLRHHNLVQSGLVLDHIVEGNSLRAFREDKNLTLILIRQKAFWDRHEQVNGAHQHGDRNGHSSGFVPERHPQGAIINPQQPIEEALEKRPQSAVPRFLGRAQEAAA